ncbi:hypothetical protein [Bosea sp. (in: a-proteobacteria)]|uniref:hypothetical protein n=1 Tax=Bosea sp. (in: a-proteobacteria) TaxID=1871050 RepID=UPI0026178D62|nr:hypothetical protein [Bosea sp. (in: a-proteobacteria)]MCO5093594.1 hypothetical protein [Bosea sp. (in: a-proteobacteria)]
MTLTHINARRGNAHAHKAAAGPVVDRAAAFSFGLACAGSTGCARPLYLQHHGEWTIMRKRDPKTGVERSRLALLGALFLTAPLAACGIGDPGSYMTPSRYAATPSQKAKWAYEEAVRRWQRSEVSRQELNRSRMELWEKKGGRRPVLLEPKPRPRPEDYGVPGTSAQPRELGGEGGGGGGSGH